jgi:hypothetical protein
LAARRELAGARPVSLVGPGEVSTTRVAKRFVRQLGRFIDLR